MFFLFSKLQSAGIFVVLNLLEGIVLRGDHGPLAPLAGTLLGVQEYDMKRSNFHQYNMQWHLIKG